MNSTFLITLFLTVSFFVGLILNKIMECIFNIDSLSKVSKKMHDTLSKLLAKPYIIERNQTQPCAEDFYLSKSKKNIEEIAGEDNKDADEIEATYVWCYFRAEKNNLLTTVHILEAQVAFLRNLLPVGALMLWYYADTVTIKIISILVFIVIDILLWCGILKKQLELVWEAGLYDVKRNENTNN